MHASLMQSVYNPVTDSKQEAKVARSRLGLHSDPLLYNIPRLMDENNDRLEKLKPGSSSGWNASTTDEIADMRDFKLPHRRDGHEHGRVYGSCGVRAAIWTVQGT